MINFFILIFIIFLYFFILFILAYNVEKDKKLSNLFLNNPIIYTLSVGVYCTAWAYYGCIEKSTQSGILFLAVHIGSTLIIFFWNKLAHKLVKIKNKYSITSIGDFLSLRYGKSCCIGILTTGVALFCTIPYISLQFKSIFSIFNLLTTNSSFLIQNTKFHQLSPILSKLLVEYFVVFIVILFTIIFGFRKLDSSEKHPGVVFAVAIQSLFKIIVFSIVGIFVTYYLFRGFKDIFLKIDENSLRSILKLSDFNVNYLVIWNAHLLASMAAFMFLPRQFHIAIVENSNEKSIDTATWLFPIYLFIIGIFVIPISYGGLLKGLPHQQSHMFSILLPLIYNKLWLVILVFLGGFSASISMVIVTSIAMSIMIGNYFVNPLIEKVKKLKFLKTHILKIRWLIVSFIILIGYLFEKKVYQTFALVDIGMLGFAAILQLAPSVIGGLFWQQGGKKGAMLGISVGFLVWFLGLFLPPLVGKPDFSSMVGITDQQFVKFFDFGVPFSNVVFWSLILNIGFYIVGSLLFENNEEEKIIADEIVTIDRPFLTSLVGEEYKKERVFLQEKIEIIERILTQYIRGRTVTGIIERCLVNLGIYGKEFISIVKLGELYKEVERILSGFLGPAIAHMEMKKSNFFTPEEKMLSIIYSEKISSMKISIDELIKKVDYFEEREKLFKQHTEELWENINQLQLEIEERKKAEERVKYLTWHDILTGLYNRNFFEEELERINNENNLPIGFLICDINNLKLINNIFGYQEGNNLLIKFAEILRTCCRDEDLIARVGGDEFAVVFPRTDKKTIGDIVRKIRDLVEKESLLFISLGVAVKEDIRQDIFNVIREAENKMYRHKFMCSESNYGLFIHALINLLYEKNQETKAHTERLKKLLLEFGKVLNFSESDLDELILLSILHDIGKIAIPNVIINKPTNLTPKEMDIIRKHAEIGCRIVQSHYLLVDIARSILYHHERWDGKGYPLGAKGTEIPLMARMLSIADAYDVITHERPYKKSINKTDAIEELRKNAGTQFDPYLVELFIEEVLPKVEE